MVRTAEGLRLEVRVGGRRLTLLTDTEDGFWARFYAPVERERMRLGEPVREIEQWRRSPPELAAILRPLWAARVGSPDGGSGPRSATG
ncbi:MAG TPA: hypothetical protein VNN19_13355 [bacterium]|nr:hypothetical protein [bacterium]